MAYTPAAGVTDGVSLIPNAECEMRKVAKPMRHCVGAAQLPTADAVAESVE